MGQPAVVAVVLDAAAVEMARPAGDPAVMA